MLVTVYLERMSFDTEQHREYLIPYSDACKDLKNNLSKLSFTTEENNTITKCADLTQIDGIIASKEIASDILNQVSTDLYRLNRIQNEMKTVKLESVSISPLVFGFPIPRNDLTIICGVLLVLLYIWLAFSFKQHVRIINEVKNELKKDTNDSKSNVLDIFERVVQINFLFSTEEKTLESFFVYLLYLAAPLAMTIALINDISISVVGNYENIAKIISIGPDLIEVSVVIILWGIGYNIIQSDRKSNQVAVTNE